MQVMHSACTTILFPDSRRDLDAFRRTAAFLQERGVKGIEFYHDGPDVNRIGSVLADYDLDAIFIAVIPSKEKKLWLCDKNPAGREAAMTMMRGFLDYVRDNGIKKVMINSGRWGDDIPGELDALAESVAEIFEYAAKRNQPLELSLEPCDDHMDVFHLLGPYRRTLEFVERVNALGYPLTLTMDSAHTAETWENFTEAVTAVKKYCNHVHFANCNISQTDNPLYGDKHVGFEYPDTVWTPKTLEALYHDLELIYPGDEPLRIGIEILCREEDPFAYYDKTRAMLPFMK